MADSELPGWPDWALRSSLIVSTRHCRAISANSAVDAMHILPGCSWPDRGTLARPDEAKRTACDHVESRFERGPEELAHGLDSGLDGVFRHRVAAQQSLQEVHVAEVVEDGAVAADDELRGVMLAQPALTHLALEVVDRPLEMRPYGLA